MAPEKNKSIFRNVDKTLVLLYLALVFIGWINIYAAVHNTDHSSIFDLSQNYGKQLLWIGTSLIIVVMILLTDTRFFNVFAYGIYGIVIVVLIGVLFFGKEIYGSKSWFQIGGFALQPAEFGKFATNLAIAKYLSSIDFDKKKKLSKFIPLVIIGIPAILILLQNDTGSALVYASFGLVFYREGMPAYILAIIAGLAVLTIMALLINQFVLMGCLFALAVLIFYFYRKQRKVWGFIIALFIASSAYISTVDYAFDHFLEPHQQTRINVLLGKKIDIKKDGYNVNQSKIAIGSGKLLGKGFLKGTQTKFNFVPKQSTDFIFCTIGEEWGFLGALVLISLYISLFVRIVMIAERQRTDFARIYGYGVASILFFHFAINIGMTIGLIPVIGIPLPFLSYGGSSLWAFTILLFIFIKQDSTRLSGR